MKKLVAIIILFFAVTLNAYADKVFDELAQAVTKGEKTSVQIADLKKQLLGTTMSGSGYVADVQIAQDNSYIIVSLVLDKESSSLMPAVNLNISTSNPRSESARNLKKGEKINFSGRLIDIYADRLIILKVDTALEM